jgi:hypothetical protein
VSSDAIEELKAAFVADLIVPFVHEMGSDYSDVENSRIRIRHIASLVLQC